MVRGPRRLRGTRMATVGSATPTTRPARPRARLTGQGARSGRLTDHAAHAAEVHVATGHEVHAGRGRHARDHGRLRGGRAAFVHDPDACLISWGPRAWWN